MKTLRLALCLACSLVALPAFAAHKTIIISDSLLANADPLKVKMGNQWMGIHKWRVGDYAVVSSKLGWTTTSTRTNFFKTTTTSHSGNTFAFVLSNNTTDSAFVTAAHDLMAQSEPGLKLGNGWTMGGTGEIRESESFVVDIIINRDTTETWTLSMSGTNVTWATTGEVVARSTHEPVLTHGDRSIGLALALSTRAAPDGRPASFMSRIKSQIVPPAMGYEFIEGGHSLCAVQFFNGGLGGANTYAAWMRRDTDTRLKLVLAAAMTAVLEMECAEGGPALPEDQ